MNLYDLEVIIITIKLLMCALLRFDTLALVLSLSKDIFERALILQQVQDERYGIFTKTRINRGYSYKPLHIKQNSRNPGKYQSFSAPIYKNYDWGPHYKKKEQKLSILGRNSAPDYNFAGYYANFWLR